MDDLLVTFYGDDFTGSTDVLESLSLNGVETVLFFEPPAPSDLEDFEGVQAIGVAGQGRTMSPAEMDEALPPVFEALEAFDAEVFHYKVCSTFDSSPEVGSIGHAIDIGLDVFDSPFVPVVNAVPSLEPRGRYVLFANLFATLDGTTYRLDRHPEMRDHPITPMTESDLTRHLAAMTEKDIASFDITHIDGEAGAELRASLEGVLEEGPDVVVFDGLNHEHQRKVGRLVWEQAVDASGPLFSVGSSGLDYALSQHWRESGIIEEAAAPTSAGPVDQLIVMSGSASTVTAKQIEWALEHGFEGIRLDTERLIDPEEADAAREEAIEAARDVLAAGESPLLYSALRPDDPVIERTNERGRELGLNHAKVGGRIGAEQAKITRTLLEETDHDRVCISGGDTSGYVAPYLDIFALEFLVPVGPASPLCVAHSRTGAFDGLEIALKAGQTQTTNAEPDYFGVVREGGKVPE